VSVLCRVLNVNRSTYYKFINRKESKRELENKRIRRCILDLYAKSSKRLGAEKITLCLKRDYRINISVDRVRRLMKGMNLPKMSTVKPAKFKAGSDEGKCENILCQRFEQTAPNLVWVSDFTYLKAGGRFYYLCAVMDLYSRKIIAYKLSDKINTRHSQKFCVKTRPINQNTACKARIIVDFLLIELLSQGETICAPQA